MKALLFGLSTTLVVIFAITVFVTRPERKRFEARAAQMDQVCQRVKSVLETNEREIRTNGPSRDVIIGRFGQEDRIDSVTLINLCTDDSLRLDDFNTCAAGQDHACLANIMRQTAQKVR